MNDQENRRNIARGLLGGYATGTLSEDERRLLFEVAMEDQEIFDELGREQALKEMLETPGVRDRLAAALGPAPHSSASAKGVARAHDVRARDAIRRRRQLHRGNAQPQWRSGEGLGAKPAAGPAR